MGGGGGRSGRLMMGVPNIELIMKTPLLEMVIIMQVPLSISSIGRRPSQACVCVRSGQETRLMMGVSNIELILKTPLLEMVKVPLSMSSMAMRPCIMSLCVCVCMCECGGSAVTRANEYRVHEQAS